MDFQTLHQEGYLQALARLFDEEDEAFALLREVGVPLERMPQFTSAEPFWSAVCRKIDKGIGPVSLEDLLRAAAARYPGSLELARFAPAESGVRTPLGIAMPLAAASPNDRRSGNGQAVAWLALVMAILAILLGTHTLQRLSGDAEGRVAQHPPGAMLLSMVPVGTILLFGGDPESLPDGWLPCNGDSQQWVKYPELAETIGTAYGGDPGTFFNVPDLRGRFPRGVDAGAGIDPDAVARGASKDGGNTGDQVGSLQKSATAMPSQHFRIPSSGEHLHVIGDGGNASDGDGPYIDTSRAQSGAEERTDALQRSGRHAHTLEGGDAETRPVNVAVWFIIKAR